MAKAVCRLLGDRVAGELTLVHESEDAVVAITGEITGLTEGQHGIQVRTYGDISADFANIGGIYNPFGNTHGAPTDSKRCAGDLGNVEANAAGVATVNIEDKHIKLIGPLSIIGRSIVVFERPDDQGRGGEADSLTTGNVGTALAAGVIGIGR